MDNFGDIIAELVLSPAERAKLKEDFEFNLQAEQEEFNQLLAMNSPVGCRRGCCDY